MKKVFRKFILLSTSTLLSFTVSAIQESMNHAAYAKVTAKEMVNFPLVVPGRGAFTYNLSYKVSVKEDGFFGRERIFNAFYNNPVIKGVPSPQIITSPCMAVNRLKWMCSMSFTIDTSKIPPDQFPEMFNVMFTTTVEQRFENDLIKEEQMLSVDGNPIIMPALPGFEFKDKKQPNEYVLHNNSNEDFTVNRLLVRTNRNQLDFNTFDINNPDLLSWDFELTNPFTLVVGESFVLPINTLTPGLFSQFWVDVIGNTSGARVLDTGEHEHPVPEPSSILGLLALGTLGARSALKRKLKPSKSTEKETKKVS